MINRDWALTAAHVIWDAPLGADGLPYRIDVSLGLNGRAVALVTTADYSIDPAYTGGAEAVHDVALIRLANPAPLGAYIYKIEAPSDAVLNRKDGAGFNIFGYPEDKPNRLWGATGFLSGVYAQSMTYKIDTCPGQSGAPIIYRTKSDRYVIGVHTNGVSGASCKVDASEFNEGARVTSSFKRWVLNAQAAFTK